MLLTTFDTSVTTTEPDVLDESEVSVELVDPISAYFSAVVSFVDEIFVVPEFPLKIKVIAAVHPTIITTAATAIITAIIPLLFFLLFCPLFWLLSWLL